CVPPTSAVSACLTCRALPQQRARHRDRARYMQLYRALSLTLPMSSSPVPAANPRSHRIARITSPGTVAALVSIMLRMWSLSQLSNTALFDVPDGDPRYYLDWALRIFGGTLSDGKAFYGLPLYPYWLAFLFAVFGVNLFAPLVIQAVADSLTAYLI